MLSKIAKEWIGVPFVIGGTTKNGCDCVGLIIGILHQMNIEIVISEYLELGYYNHLSINIMRSLINKYFYNAGSVPAVDDVIIFSTFKNVYHFAIINNLNPLTIIHAHQGVGRVVENAVDRHLLNILGYFRVKVL